MKKTGTEKFIPDIKAGFIKTMTEKHGVDKEEADKLIVNFIKVIEDASSYLFSINHSLVYSWIGYICGYLRYYYPYEFITTALNIFEDKEEKTLRITEYAKSVGIKIEGIKFRYSTPEYSFNKETKSIYKGMKSIKYLNKKMSRDLYRLRDREFRDFYELLDILHKETSVNSRQLEILIQLDFFSEFGNPNQLLYQNALYTKYFGKKQFTKEKLTIDEMMALSLCNTTETEKLIRVSDPMEIIRVMDNSKKIKTSLSDRIQYEIENLGYVDTIIPELPPDYAVVTKIDGKYANKNVTLYRINDSSTEVVKVKGKKLEIQPLKEGQIIKTIERSEQKKWRKGEDGKFFQIDEYETILTQWKEVK